MSPREAAISDLEGRLDYAFIDKSLIDRALTHASIGEGVRTARAGRLADNERLEFLGDRVLGLLTAQALLERDPRASEGEMALQLNALVNREACAAAARRMGLGDALRLSPSETRMGGRDRPSILADACEAVIAAVYLDGGLEAARGLFLRFWRQDLEGLAALGAQDPKSALQERVQGMGKPTPSYRLVGREGPDHAPLFTAEAQVLGLSPATGSGASRQAAEKAAAQSLLDREFSH